MPVICASIPGAISGAGGTSLGRRSSSSARCRSSWEISSRPSSRAICKARCSIKSLSSRRDSASRFMTMTGRFAAHNDLLLFTRGLMAGGCFLTRDEPTFRECAARCSRFLSRGFFRLTAGLTTATIFLTATALFVNGLPRSFSARLLDTPRFFVTLFDVFRLSVSGLLRIFRVWILAGILLPLQKICRSLRAFPKLLAECFSLEKLARYRFISHFDACGKNQSLLAY